jgi:hypothetical protein
MAMLICGLINFVLFIGFLMGLVGLISYLIIWIQDYLRLLKVERDNPMNPIFWSKQ